MNSNHSSSGYSKWSDAARERWEDFWSSRGAIERVLLVLEDNTDCIPWGSAEDFLRKEQATSRKVTIRRARKHSTEKTPPSPDRKRQVAGGNGRTPRANLVSASINEAPAHVVSASIPEASHVVSASIPAADHVVSVSIPEASHVVPAESSDVPDSGSSEPPPSPAGPTRRRAPASRKAKARFY